MTASRQSMDAASMRAAVVADLIRTRALPRDVAEQIANDDDLLRTVQGCLTKLDEVFPSRTYKSVLVLGEIVDIIDRSTRPEASR